MIKENCYHGVTDRLLSACWNGDSFEISYCLEALNVNVNIAESTDRIAGINTSTKLANARADTTGSFTPLEIAVISGDIDTINTLLFKYGADVTDNALAYATNLKLAIIKDLLQAIQNLKPLLEQFEIPVDGRKKYYESEVTRSAALKKLIGTRDDLDRAFNSGNILAEQAKKSHSRWL